MLDKDKRVVQYVKTPDIYCMICIPTPVFRSVFMEHVHTQAFSKVLNINKVQLKSQGGVN